MRPTDAAHPFTVYFDGSCPMCRSEIAFYQGKRGADTIDWIDVSRPAALDNDPRLTCASAMRRFHVALEDGSLQSGGPAFLALWQRLPAFRALGHLLSHRPLVWIVALAYEVFLPVRPLFQSAYRRMARAR